MKNSIKKLLKLKKQAQNTIKKVDKKPSTRTVYIIENDSDGILKHEVLIKSDKEIASMIINGRIDPKEKLYKAILQRVNKREAAQQNVF
jgi:hypothetical protein